VEPEPGHDQLLADLVPGQETLARTLGPRRLRTPQGTPRPGPGRAAPKAAIERLLTRRDIPVREKTLWRMLYESAARTSEILALNVEDLDLENRKAPIRSKGGAKEEVYWGTGTAHLLPRLLRLPDGTSRTSGRCSCPERKPVPARRPGPRDICPHTGRPGSATTGAASCSAATPSPTRRGCHRGHRTPRPAP
jgi:integrase